MLKDLSSQIASNTQNQYISKVIFSISAIWIASSTWPGFYLGKNAISGLSGMFIYEQLGYVTIKRGI